MARAQKEKPTGSQTESSPKTLKQRQSIKIDHEKTIQLRQSCRIEYYVTRELSARVEALSRLPVQVRSPEPILIQRGLPPTFPTALNQLRLLLLRLLATEQIFILEVFHVVLNGADNLAHVLNCSVLNSTHSSESIQLVNKVELF